MNKFWPPLTTHPLGFPGDSDSKESARNAGDMGSIPGSRRSPEEEKGNPPPVFLPAESPWTKKPGKLYIVHEVVELDKSK